MRLIAISSVLLCALRALAAQPVNFTNDIAPILVQKCLICHGPDKSKGSYRVDTYDWLLKPGSSKEPAITPGNSGKSKLFELITTDDEEDRMPQKNEPLSPPEIARIKDWITQGAHFAGADSKAPLVSIIPPIRQPDAPAVYPSPIPITALAFSIDGAELAVGGFHEITIWSTADGKLRRRLKNVAQSTLALAYDPSGKWLAAASGTPGKLGELKIFDPASGQLARVLATSGDFMLSVAFSPDGAKLAAGSSDNSIRLFDFATGKLERKIEQHSDWVTGLAFSHNGLLLASASRDKSARIYEVKTGEMTHSFLGHGDFVYAVAFAPDDVRAISAGRDRKVHLWKMEEAKKDKPSEISGFEGEVFKLLATTNSIFTCASDGLVRQHSLDKTHALVRTFGTPGEVIYSIALDAHATCIAAGSYDGKVRLWNIGDGKLVSEFIAAPGLAAASN
ncbi:MAG TPA: c-type cytochrome domain-containing protein [Verrucomicrobiae bacterium]